MVNSIGQVAAFLSYFPFHFLRFHCFDLVFRNSSRGPLFSKFLSFWDPVPCVSFPLRTSHTRYLVTGDLRDKGFCEREIIHRRVSRSDLKSKPVIPAAAALKLPSGIVNHHDCRCRTKNPLVHLFQSRHDCGLSKNPRTFS
jgi:hypothetical protein